MDIYGCNNTDKLIVDVVLIPMYVLLVTPVRSPCEEALPHLWLLQSRRSMSVFKCYLSYHACGKWSGNVRWFVSWMLQTTGAYKAFGRQGSSPVTARALVSAWKTHQWDPSLSAVCMLCTFRNSWSTSFGINFKFILIVHILKSKLQDILLAILKALALSLFIMLSFQKDEKNWPLASPSVCQWDAFQFQIKIINMPFLLNSNVH